MPALRYALSSDDLLVIDGIELRCRRVTDDGYVFEGVHDERQVTTYSFERFERARMRSSFEHHENYFNAKRASIKLAFDKATFAYLPDKKAQDAAFRLACCEAFLLAEARGEAKRSEASIETAIKTFTPAILTAFPDRAVAQGKLIVTPRTMFRWLERFEPTLEADPATANDPVVIGDAMALVDRYHKSGRFGCRHADAVVDEVARAASVYISGRRPTYAAAHREMIGRIAMMNAARADAGETAYAIPSVAFLKKEIRKADAFDVVANRRGLGRALRQFRPTGRGLQVAAPLDRVEMDGFQTHLMTWMSDLEAFKRLSPRARREIEKARLTLILAVDAATRMPLAATLAREENAEAVKAALRQINEPKTRLSEAVGAAHSWVEHGRAKLVVTDMGSGFVSSDIKQAAAGCGMHYVQPPGGKPQLRPIVENMFHRLDDELLSHFVGRTFSDISDKDERDPVAEASTFIDQFTKAMVVYLTDIYAEAPQRMLGGLSPRAAWNAAHEQAPQRLPASKHVLRNVFGFEVTRTLGASGIRFDNIRYHSHALAQMFVEHGSIELQVKVDPQDLGAVSVFVDGRWAAIPAVFAEQFEGMHLDAWRDIQADLSRRYSANMTVHLAEIAERRAALDAEAEQARIIAGVHVKLDGRRLAYLKRDTRIAFRLADDHEKSLETAATDGPALELVIAQPEPPPAPPDRPAENATTAWKPGSSVRSKRNDAD